MSSNLSPNLPRHDEATPSVSQQHITAVITALVERGQSVAMAESLTGGLVCAALIDEPGASEVVHGGIVAYTPPMKTELLKVPADLIEKVGTVHRDVAAAMAQGAQLQLHSHWGVATTGVAGPGPHEGHRQGTAFVAVAGPNCPTAVRGFQLEGDRAQVRLACRDAAIALLLDQLQPAA